MRQLNVTMNISRHHKSPGVMSGMKVELPASKLPMSLLCAMRNVPFQWRAWWGGPESPEPPVLRVLWGWQPEEDWTPGWAYARHEKNRGATRLKWTWSRGAIRFHTSQDYIPVGRWQGVLTCEPDEEAPTQIALTVRPRTYVPRPPVPVAPKSEVPAADKLLPQLKLLGP